MNDDAYEKEQERVWSLLYTRLQEILRRFGKEDRYGKADYWLIDENWGPRQHNLLVSNLKLLAPHIVKKLQATLAEFSDWDIVVAVAVGGAGESWPAMGIVIRSDEIIDGLQRQYFPKGFQGLKYEGSTPGDYAAE